MPGRDHSGKSLSALIKQQLTEEQDPLPKQFRHRGGDRRGFSEEESLAVLRRRVSEKLEDDDISGTIRLASSEDRLAYCSDDTLTALQLKHPDPLSDVAIPPSPPPKFISVNESNVARPIKSFPNGSAGGPIRLRPQHLKDMLQSCHGEHCILSSLASFCSLVLGGRSGGVRPIAVGRTLRRLVAKVACLSVVDEMAELLSPRQLGYGVKGGAEAAAHEARNFLQNLSDGSAMVKLVFRNAFNSIHRDRMLEAVRDLAPTIYQLVHSAYSSPSCLVWGNIPSSLLRVYSRVTPLFGHISVGSCFMECIAQ